MTISRNGGVQVRWRRDGKALFYLSLDDHLMMVPIRETADGQIEPGAPTPLFVTRTRGAVQPFPRYQYGVSADGRRFLMAASVDDEVAAPLSVVLNWSHAQ